MFADTEALNCGMKGATSKASDVLIMLGYMDWTANVLAHRCLKIKILPVKKQK